MAKYLQRRCPRCSGYLGIELRQTGANTTVRAINGRLRFCGGVADSRFVGDVDHASDDGHPFATSVVRSNKVAYHS
jgi:hypothetical protein